MVRINLLPVRQIKRRQRAVQELFVFALSLVVVLMAIGVASGVIAHSITSMKQQIQELQVRKSSYNAILAQIEELKQKKKSLEAKIDSIKKLKKNSQVAVRILDEIANRTPSRRVWLKSLKQAGNSLKLSGVALDNATIAQYMIDLAGSPSFATADLVSSSQTKVAGSKLKAFTLNVGLTPPATEEAGVTGQKMGKTQ